MKRFICFFASCICLTGGLVAQIALTLNELETSIFESYELLLSKRVTNDLVLNYKNYLLFPNKYWDFLDKTFLDNWDFDATTKALIGYKIFNSLSDSQFKELSQRLELTLVRYAFESLNFYDEQTLNVISVKVNEQQTLGWLKINIESPRFPDIHLDLLLKRTDDYQWKGVDFRFKGITYVNMKKNIYRQDFEDLKFRGLLRKLDDKNNLFFRELCQSKANYIDPKMPPCLHNYDKK